MTATASSSPTTSILSDDALQRFHSRASAYDRENRFFTEDFKELRDSGYLKQLIPADMGGPGGSLTSYIEQLKDVAYHAPATALATNMHMYWTGVAANMRAMGDSSLEWMLGEAANGEVAMRLDLALRFEYGSAPLATAKPAPSCPSSFPPPKPSAWMAATASPATRSSAASAPFGHAWASTA